MTDEHRDPAAKRMTFDEMANRAQYEWQRAEDAEAECRALHGRITDLEAALKKQGEASDEQLRVLVNQMAKQLKRITDLEARLAAAEAGEDALAEALRAFERFDNRPLIEKRPDIFERMVRRPLLAALAAYEARRG